ncbi:MAG: Nucleolar protein 12 [Pycnora praestabilis]|nr:MAG: Nucleolar protein 12 [Pycnora praestabilis]
MGKPKQNKTSRDQVPEASSDETPSIYTSPKTVDPILASLFASSSGPIEVPFKRKLSTLSSHHTAAEVQPSADSLSTLALTSSGDLSPIDSEDLDGDITDPSSGSEAERPTEEINLGKSHSIVKANTRAPLAVPGEDSQGRKRRRKDVEEDVEDTYMRRLVREEAGEDARRRIEAATLRLERDARLTGSQTTEDETGHEMASDDAASDVVIEDEDQDTVPQHESLAHSIRPLELEKSSRTVFLSNVSTLAITSKSAKKLLLTHLGSFLPSLSSTSTAHKVESLRFRSTAFSSSAVPKKAAFAKKELMDATTKSTNAYAVYTTPFAAREATKRLNGTIILERHLRVDGVAHPAKVDHRRCVFVGNLGFVDDESLIRAAEDEGKKRPQQVKQPGDVEEGLWRQFGKAGAVESVRVIRDPRTRVGKGIAYIQFIDPNAVEAALLYHDKSYPPLLPRKLRVTRAKHVKKTSSAQNSKNTTRAGSSNNAKRIYNPKTTSRVQSLEGRAGKLLGRAGATHFRTPSRGSENDRTRGVAKTPESIVFEGYRASKKIGKEGIKMGGSGKKKGKPRTRSSKRGSAWKASGGTKDGR